jgi:hypothetical protein
LFWLFFLSLSHAGKLEGSPRFCGAQPLSRSTCQHRCRSPMRLE